MAEMTGADAADLEHGASELAALGRQIGGMRRPLRSQLYSSPWRGASSERFRRDWDRVHSPALAEVEEFLTAAAATLQTQAQEQLGASSDPGGAFASPGGPSRSDVYGAAKDALEDIKALLADLGVPLDIIKKLIGHLETIGAIGDLEGIELLSGPLRFLVENKQLGAIIDGAGTALSRAGMVTDFLTTFLDHPELPIDEGLVLAVTTVGIGLAISAGVKAATTAVVTMIGTAVAPGAGTVVGRIIGPVVGAVISSGVSYADEQLGVSDAAAGGVLDAYRYAKERDFDADRIAIDAAGDVAENVKDSVVEVRDNLYEEGRERLGNLFGMD